MLNSVANFSPDMLASVNLQSRGIVFGLSRHDANGTIIAVSTSVRALWNKDPVELIGSPLSAHLDLSNIDADEWAKLHLQAETGPFGVTDTHGQFWFVSVTHRNGQVLVHLEDPGTDARDDAEAVQETFRFLDSLQRVSSVDSLWALGSERLREWLDFDRTFVIQTGAKTHTVIAESVRPGLSSILDAVVDLPLGEQPLGVSGDAQLLSVGESAAEPAKIHPAFDQHGAPWDLSQSPLREVPPGLRRAHACLEAAASYVIHVGDEEVSYIVVSMNAQPRTVNPLVRARTSYIAELIFFNARMAQQHHDSACRLDRADRYGAFVEYLRSADGAMDADTLVRTDGANVLEMVRADSVVLRLGGQVRTLGGVTPVEQAAVVRSGERWTHTLQQQRVLLMDNVSTADPQLHASAPEISGILTTPLGHDGSFVSWIRRRTPRPALHIRLDVDGLDGHSLCSNGSVEPERPWVEIDTQYARSFAQAVEDQMLRSAEAELLELALIDPLTGLPNRRLLRERIDQALKRRRRGHEFVLAFIDLNDFKNVNDTFGHHIGDRLLMAIAERLQETVREADTVSRLGGDEFVVLFEDVTSGERAVIQERLQDHFSAPFFVHDKELTIRAAVGTATAHTADTVDSLLERADVVMYEVKTEMKSS